MRVITRGRRGGKTSELVKLFREDPASVLVVPIPLHKTMLSEHFKLTPDELARVYVAGGGALRGISVATRVLVDNADLILAQLLGHSVNVISVTGD